MRTPRFAVRGARWTTHLVWDVCFILYPVGMFVSQSITLNSGPRPSVKQFILTV